MIGTIHDWSKLAQVCVRCNHREAMEQTKTLKHFSKPLFDSHLLVDMAEPESRGGAEHLTQSRRALQSYMAKCMNKRWLKNGGY